MMLMWMYLSTAFKFEFCHEFKIAAKSLILQLTRFI